VTAHRHLNIVEVPATPLAVASSSASSSSSSSASSSSSSSVKYGHIIRYLQQWRQRGYSVIALEQSSSSVAIHNYTFPDRVCVLLGKEREVSVRVCV
jgi:tRNA G18 (ribose-2'-O)-methylase SpoU